MTQNNTKINVTLHAQERTKERIGIPKSASQKNAINALSKGLSRTDIKGSLRRYLDSLLFKYNQGENIRVHGGFVYIFEGTTLITVFPLPPKYRSRAGIITQKHKGNQSNKH